MRITANIITLNRASKSVAWADDVWWLIQGSTDAMRLGTTEREKEK
jgi:hypothetical protein